MIRRTLPAPVENWTHDAWPVLATLPAPSTTLRDNGRRNVALGLYSAIAPHCSPARPARFNRIRGRSRWPRSGTHVVHGSSAFDEVQQHLDAARCRGSQARCARSADLRPGQSLRLNGLDDDLVTLCGPIVTSVRAAVGAHDTYGSKGDAAVWRLAFDFCRFLASPRWL